MYLGYSHLLDLEDITRDDIRGINLLEGTITENNSLEGESLLEFVDNGTGLEFLEETDACVEEQETADNTEIDPIFETGSKDGSSLKVENDSLANNRRVNQTETRNL